MHCCFSLPYCNCYRIFGLWRQDIWWHHPEEIEILHLFLTMYTSYNRLFWAFAKWMNIIISCINFCHTVMAYWVFAVRFDKRTKQHDCNGSCSKIERKHFFKKTICKSICRITFIQNALLCNLCIGTRTTTNPALQYTFCTAFAVINWW